MALSSDPQQRARVADASRRAKKQRVIVDQVAKSLTDFELTACVVRHGSPNW
jgi:hypothetical protein